jgi:hypothetical protein
LNLREEKIHPQLSQKKQFIYFSFLNKLISCEVSVP